MPYVVCFFSAPLDAVSVSVGVDVGFMMMVMVTDVSTRFVGGGG